MSQKSVLTTFVIILVLALGGGAFLYHQNKISNQPSPSIQMPGTLPMACTQEAKQCPDGSYVSRSGPKCEFKACPEVDTHADLINVSIPKSNQILTSPFLIQGEARGVWYFEGSFPVHLLDANGKEIVSTPAQAQSEWMTSKFVPFEATLTFDKPTTATGILILEKDNPSDQPEFDDQISIPVRFAP